MEKILILYFSGAGATKKIAEFMQTFLSNSQDCIADVFSIENFTGFMNDYDAIIIGTPVYHGTPSRVVKDYFNTVIPLMKPIPAFIYNTRGLWSCNTNRILAKLLQSKNIITIKDKDYRSPASDGVLIVPFAKRLFKFERNLHTNIGLDCTEFMKLLRDQNPCGYIPHFRFSSIINAPNKLVGQLVTFKIYLHRDKCVKCGKCIENCPHHALKKNDLGYPLFFKEKCENCYRCIHHCPAKALSLSKHRTPKKLLTFDTDD